ncbi:hypothetical protein J3B02_000192 [Coemansia erecta]|uniref:SCP domain-containing protein n=1 Tax=Coemansia asiatica TaxID=1052880 RepID=A0A9W7XJ41_9FUNG|nr:hypothetical protein LPJ64_002731 [Coemansia asiatica]KAJ2858442.1 hypothetical protein J3B02_000192 [Coemansia erecta]
MKLVSAIAVLAATISSINAQSSVGPTVGQDLCCATNVERAKRGLSTLKWVRELETSSQRHSDYQRSTGVMDHMEKPGTQTYALGGRLEAVGFDYSTAGENLGTGFDDVDSLTTAWMNSPGHRANILGQGYTVCGGAVANPGGFYTINYAAPMSGYKPVLYDLKCSGSKSLGATPQGGSPAPAAASPTPVGHSAQSSSAPQAVAPAVTTVVNNNGSSSTTPQPVGHSAPQPANTNGPSSSGSPSGKCKRVPKGSIAAGKCKPCKKCGANASPFRR